MLQQPRPIWLLLLGCVVLFSGAGETAAGDCPFNKGTTTVETVTFIRDFKYLEPGVLFPPTSSLDASGHLKTMRHRRYVALPEMSFPFKIDEGRPPAFMQSMVGSFGGCGSPDGDGPADRRNLMHPDRDTFGEVRDYRNPFASDLRGHQGCDIRTPSGRKNVDEVLAVEGGKVASVSPRGGVIEIETKSREQGGSGTRQIYRHIERMFVRRDDTIEMGQPIGLAGAMMQGNSNGTVPHLHLEIVTRSIALPATGGDSALELSNTDWNIVLPCYPSLIAAKMRALKLMPNLIGNQLMPDTRYEVTLEQFRKGTYAQSPVAGTPPTPPALESELATAPPDGKRYDSYWTIENPIGGNALLGLVVGGNDTQEFHLLTPRRTMFARTRTARTTDELVFRGRIERDAGETSTRTPARDTRSTRNEAARYVGTLTWLDPNENVSARCKSKDVPAAGPILDNPLRVELTAPVPLHDSACNEVGQRSDTFVLLFYGNAPPGGGGPSDAPVILDKDRHTIAEVTRNWGAITMSKGDRSTWMLQAVVPKFANDPGRIMIPRDDYRWVYVGEWPGLRTTGHRTDKYRDTVPAFEADEAGIALWWYWVKQRKRSYFKSDGNPTLREIAQIYGGDRSSALAVDNYLSAYLSHGRRYFKNGVPSPDTPIRIADPEQRFALAWTMFHHEAGRTPIIERSTFDRGVLMGEDLMGRRFARLCDYLSDQSSCSGAPQPASSEPSKPAPDARPPVVVRPDEPTVPAVPEGPSAELSRLRREAQSLSSRLQRANDHIAVLERRLLQLKQIQRPAVMHPGQRTMPADCTTGSGWLFCATLAPTP
jgi:murein DD-endopeptidase MepM/ murein hydrolase activator NlpD